MSLDLKKSLVLADALAKRLTLRFSGNLTVTQGFHTDGSPLIYVDDGTPATSEQCALIQIVEVSTLGLNAVGSTQQSYGPHIAKVCFEESATGGVAYFSAANSAKLLGEVSAMGTKIELYLSDNTNVPSVAQMTAANLFAEFQDLYFPTLLDM